MIHLLTTKILQLAALFPTYRQPLVSIPFIWINAFISDMKSDPSLVTFGIAALVGLFNAIRLEYAWVLQSEDHLISNVMALLLSDEFKLVLCSESKTSEYTKLQLYSSLFNAAKEYAASLVLEGTSSSSFEFIWEEFISERKVFPGLDSMPSKTLELMHQNLSDSKWIRFAGEYPSDSDFLVSIVQTCVLCALYIPALHSVTVSQLSNLLMHTPEVPESQSLDAYLATLEGLGILTLKY